MPQENYPTSINRRYLLAGLAAVTGSVSFSRYLTDAFAAETASDKEVGTPFSRATLDRVARSLAKEQFEDRQLELEGEWSDLSYDEYRDIRFRADNAIWKNSGTPYQMHLFAPGGIFNRPVDIHVVENGRAHRLTFSREMFSFGEVVTRSRPGFRIQEHAVQLMAREEEAHPRKRASSRSVDEKLTYSGFRIHGFLNTRKYRDEFLVFQGASYFRATGKGQNYGLSARGLAINTGRSSGEEFPYFRAFWIERPTRKSRDIVIHALLDSMSLTGAYTFRVRPGKDTVMDVEATLYPRAEAKHIGLAPLTSMFLFRQSDRRNFDDFRPAVHDSNGLAMLNGNGEWLWRPLANPRQLQISSFMDTNPKGFGLIQRNRDFKDYEDLEARYEKRPSLWIEPRGDWGKGEIELIEIPTDSEINDNIVAFWKPRMELNAGQQFSFAYRMYWGWGERGKRPPARVVQTMIGKPLSSGKETDNQRRFVIDFEGKNLAGKDLPKAQISLSRGHISHLDVRENPVTRGIRASFILDAEQEQAIDLRMNLASNDKPVSEVWMYRWTR